MSNPRTRPVLLLLASLALPLAIPAQEAGTANSQAPGTQTISIDFRGGSLEQFVDAICRAGKNINILLSSAGSKINLPPMKLHNAGVEAALQAAGQIVTSDYRIQVRPYQAGCLLWR
jgi:hypothetical protein